MFDLENILHASPYSDAEGSEIDSNGASAESDPNRTLPVIGGSLSSSYASTVTTVMLTSQGAEKKASTQPVLRGPLPPIPLTPSSSMSEVESPPPVPPHLSRLGTSSDSFPSPPSSAFPESSLTEVTNLEGGLGAAIAFMNMSATTGPFAPSSSRNVDSDSSEETVHDSDNALDILSDIVTEGEEEDLPLDAPEPMEGDQASKDIVLAEDIPEPPPAPKKKPPIPTKPPELSHAIRTHNLQQHAERDSADVVDDERKLTFRLYDQNSRGERYDLELLLPWTATRRDANLWSLCFSVKIEMLPRTARCEARCEDSASAAMDGTMRPFSLSIHGDRESDE
ncbi:unnamed protein product [Cyprideis torosa]|uniref:Uncharacterized protein n=1 Tax=Cyprideis torosa TaxID=163714 RepID=A0A7R8WL14_9CRUS|nr:unnamed protein product [Cyprideis torosa]CAG0903824.1 unnamed protein product [Cyprideis torosa]